MNVEFSKLSIKTSYPDSLSLKKCYLMFNFGNSSLLILIFKHSTCILIQTNRPLAGDDFLHGIMTWRENSCLICPCIIIDLQLLKPASWISGSSPIDFYDLPTVLPTIFITVVTGLVSSQENI